MDKFLGFMKDATSNSSGSNNSKTVTTPQAQETASLTKSMSQYAMGLIGNTLTRSRSESSDLAKQAKSDTASNTSKDIETRSTQSTDIPLGDVKMIKSTSSTSISSNPEKLDKVDTVSRSSSTNNIYTKFSLALELDVTNDEKLDLSSKNSEFDFEDELELDSLPDEMKLYQSEVDILAVLEQGTDINDIAKQEEQKRIDYEKASINDYVAESERLAQLYHQLTDCDDILGAIENMLQTFKSDLDGITDDIRYLKERSYDMNIKMRNRKVITITSV